MSARKHPTASAARDGRGLVMPPGRAIPRSPSPRPAKPPPEASASGLDDPSLVAPGAELAELAAGIRSCERCGPVGAPRVCGSGFPRAPLFLLKARPGPEDVASATAFAAEAPSLQRAFDRLAVPMAWVYGTTAVRTLPGPDDVRDACLDHLLTELEVVRPRAVVAFGEEASVAMRALDGRCGLRLPEDVQRGEPVRVREDLALLVTEELPEGVTVQASKRRLWRDLQRVPALLA